VKVLTGTSTRAGLLGLCFGLHLSLAAQPFYYNGETDLAVQFDPGTLEVGNEIDLADATGAITRFAFEFWGTNTAGPGSFWGNVKVRVRFYLFDGLNSSSCICSHYSPRELFEPGNLIYESGWMPVPPTPRSTLILGEEDFPPEGIPLLGTTKMTWTVQFAGMGPTEKVGLDIYSPPTIGSARNYFWKRTNNFGWVAQTNTTSIPMQFAACVSQSSVKLDSPTWTSTGKFSFRIAGFSPEVVAIEASTNLFTWVGVTNRYLWGGQTWYTNTAATSPAQFFRARPLLTYSGVSPPFNPLSTTSSVLTSADAIDYCRCVTVGP